MLSSVEEGLRSGRFATWTAAAGRLGHQAAGGDLAALEVLRRHLEGDVHMCRHASCAAAVYLSEGGEANGLPSITSRVPGSGKGGGWHPGGLLGELDSLCQAHLASTGATVGELDLVPRWRAAFEEWRREGVARERQEYDKRLARGAPSAEATLVRVEFLERLDDSTPLRDVRWHTKPAQLRDPWQLPSYLEGVNSPRALQGLPVGLLVRVLCATASGRPGQICLVKALPGMLSRLRAGGHLCEAEFQDLLRLVAATDSAKWMATPDHLLEFWLSLAEASGKVDLFDQWRGVCGEDAALRARVDRLAEVARTGDGKGAARVLRDLLKRLPADEWSWRLLDSPAREVELTELAYLLESDLVDLEQRIGMNVAALQNRAGLRKEAVQLLVRCLTENLAARRRRLGDPSRTPGGVAPAAPAVWSRELFSCLQAVAPLLVDWGLPGTAAKDLGGLAAGLLSDCLSECPEYFGSLFYSVMYCLPERAVLREMAERSADPRLVALLESATAVLGIARKARRFQDCGESRAEAWRAYLVYAANLEALVRGRGLPRESRATWRSPGDLRPVLGYLCDPAHGRRGPDAAARQSLQDLLFLRAFSQHIQGHLSRTGQPDAELFEEQEDDLALRADAEASEAAELFLTLAGEARALEDRSYGRHSSLPGLDLEGWSRLGRLLHELRSQAARSLPYVEREVAGLFLRARAREVEEDRTRLARIVDEEGEEEALQTEPGDRLWRPLEAWMLRRQMVHELARKRRLFPLPWLTSPWVVGAWVFLPPLCSRALAWAGHLEWAGLPYAVAVLLNLATVGWMLAAVRKSEIVGRGELFLPQVTGALFLGVLEVTGTDEGWALGILEYAWVRLVMLVLYGVGAYMFTRELILRGQFRRPEDQARRNDRAARVMALGLWQSMVLVTLFGVLGGGVMGRRLLGASPSDFLGSFIPHEVGLGQWFFQAATPPGEYRIFPWLLLTWTFQVYFLSAILGRVLNTRQEE